MIYYIGNNLIKYEGVEECSLEEMYEYCKEQDILGIDIETTRKYKRGIYLETVYKPGLDPRVTNICMLQIGTIEKQFVIDCRCFSNDILKKYLVPIFLNEKILKVGHYLKFENSHFLHNYNVVMVNVWDTHICEKILYNGYEFKFTLEALMNRYLGIKSIKSIDLFNNEIKDKTSYLSSDDKFLLGIQNEDTEIFVDKGTRLQFIEIGDKPFTLQQIEYGASDITAPLKIQKEQIKGRIVDNKIWNPVVGFKLENKFVSVLSRVQYKGMPFDSLQWLKVYKENHKEYIRRLNFFNKYIVENYPNFSHAVDLFTNEPTCAIEWSSSKQSIVYFRHLGICPKERSKSTKRMEWTVGAKAMFKILSNPYKLKFYASEFPEKIKCQDDIVLAYLLLKKSEQLCTTFGKDFIRYVHPITKRIHCNFNQYMISSRLSSTSPNMQNIPSLASFRNCFTDGKQYVNADFSGQESRILAHVSKVRAFLDFYINGHEIFGSDLHSLVGTLMKRKLTGDEKAIVTKKTDPETRQNAKALNFKMAYGGGAYTIAQELGIPIEEAEILVKAFFDGLEGLEQDFEKTKKLALKRGWVQLDAYTDKRYFYPHFDRMKEILIEVYKLTKYPPKTKIPEKEKERLRKDTNWTKLWREYMVHKGKLERRSLNLRIQGSAASQTKLAAIIFYNERVDDSQQIINMIHDEVLATCDEHLLDNTAKLLTDSMAKGGHYITPSIPMPAEAVISYVWEH